MWPLWTESIMVHMWWNFCENIYLDIEINILLGISVTLLFDFHIVLFAEVMSRYINSNYIFTYIYVVYWNMCVHACVCVCERY